MDRIANLGVDFQPSAPFREVSGLKFEQDVIETVELGVSYGSAPAEGGNAVAMEKIVIAHEGFDLV